MSRIEPLKAPLAIGLERSTRKFGQLKTSMRSETVDYSFDGRVATISLNRPDALNALSLQLTVDLLAACRQAIADGARAVVLTGNGRAFCSGGDLREMRSMWEREGRIEAFLEDPLEALHGVISLIREAPIPFIAAVNGVCAGAGTNFALACDLIVADEKATFNEAFVRIGLSPDCGGTYFLPRAVGEKLAAELFMLGGTIDAARALQIGMINRVVASEDLLEEARSIADKLAAGPTGSIGRIKRMINSTFSNDLGSQLTLEHECQIESGRSDDFREGVMAFFEKRPPDFTGK
ncbi:MAG: enoyl-CoA hydratase/isomerase family protein [Pyrinomonadaceae bacterium]|nr:enoyl-CoA hydratase/isomerase family protein [Pyrinomonadaceae bacterium]